MRRAGWGVWIAYDLPGSYEEMPPNLIDELKRDRRWCQGNLMNVAAVAREGAASGASRRVHDRRDGVPVRAAVVPASCCCRPCMLAIHTLVPPQYFVEPYQLFPLLARVAARSGRWRSLAAPRCCCSCRSS